MKGKVFIFMLAFFVLIGSANADWVDRTEIGGIATASGENANAGETADKAFDGTEVTKWLTFSSSAWIQFEFGDGNGYAISKYAITSANDAPERDPKDWDMLGSYDGVNWYVLDSVRGEPAWINRWEIKEFTMSNNYAFPIYRLDILANQSGDIIQLAEIDLFEYVAPKAFGPAPANLADGVPVDQALSWYTAEDPNNPGVPVDTVVSHELYMTGADSLSDPNLYHVASIPAGSPIEITATYDPDTTWLERDGTYLWRVDEVLNDANVILGDVWTFQTVLSVPIINPTTPENAIVWPGEAVQLSVSATNPFTGDDSGLSYAWYKVPDPNTVISTTNTYDIPSVTDPDTGQYYCTVTLDENGSQKTSRTAFVDIKNLVAHWEFDGNANDSTSYGSNGIPSGDPLYAAGIIEQAIDLDGDGDYVGVPISYPKNDRLTISAWVYARSAPQWASIAKNWPGQFHFGLMDTTGRLDFEVGPEVGAGIRVTDPDVLPLNQWQFVTGTVDGKYFRLYRNGIEVANIVYEGPLNNTNPTLYIGCKMDGSASQFWDGLIDDMRIYSSALNAMDVAELYLSVGGDYICQEHPSSDLDGDCRVGIGDFAIVASEWMRCNFVPASACP